MMGGYEKYWIKRADRRIAARQKYIDASLREIAGAYEGAMKELDRDINRFLFRFMAEENLTRAEAKRLLQEEIPAEELEEIRRRIGDITDAGIRRKLQNRLAAAYYKGRISREQAIKEAVRIQVAKIADKEINVSTEAFKAILREEYLHNIFDSQQYLGFAFSFAELPERIIEQILKNDWSGSHYSQRIWGNVQTLASHVEQIILKGALKGTNSRKMAKELNDMANTGMYACERLIRTETTYFTAMADLEAAKQRGTKKLRFVATLDNRTSRQCQEADGSIINVENAVPGKTIPPLHPFCRSVIIDVIDGLVHKVRKARNSVTGKNYMVPADMKYEDWKRLPLMEKAINFGELKNVKLLKGSAGTNISAQVVEEIKGAISAISSEYNLKLDYFEVGDYTDKEHINTPLFFRAVDEEGLYRSKLILNNACRLWQDEEARNYVLQKGYFAGDSIADFTLHELAHVMTYQSCNTMPEYYAMEKQTRLLKRFGISGYADIEPDGAETLAEAFVRKRKGKLINAEVAGFLNQYIEVWRR